MSNDIINFLNIVDGNIEILNIDTDSNSFVKTIYATTTLSKKYCPVCSSKMHSRGLHERVINHPMLLDGYEVVIRLKQRRWRCTNPVCNLELNEGFNLVGPRRRYSNSSDFLIVREFSNLEKTARQIAREFKTSPAHAQDVFDRFISMERLPLSSAICIDEVHMDMDPKCKYVMVILDFISGEPIDMLISRRVDITEPYFAGIPIQERLNVKYLISDMYNPYIEFVNKYFPNAVSVVDSFHVTQWIINSIVNYIRDLIRGVRAEIRDIQAKMIGEHKTNREIVNMLKPQSDRLYLLQKYRWLITKNQRNIEYTSSSRFDHHFKYYMTIYAYEEKLFAFYPKLKDIRDLKEQYIQFNYRNSGNPESAAKELEMLISEYKRSSFSMFVNFALLLEKHKSSIINSFIMVSKLTGEGVVESRLSNGPIESINKKIKDLKRIARGFTNFTHLRNRFLFATRKLPVWSGKESAVNEKNRF